MTWVVGASSVLGYGVMVSDVRISFSDGSEADLLRKVYPVGPYLMAGFAGSVRIGMTLIDHLQRCLYQTLQNLDQAPPGQAFAFNPDVIAEDWSSSAADIFSRMPDEERELGSQILIVGVDSSKNTGAPQFPYIHIAKLSWPDFKPEFSPQSWHVQHIGSGSDIEKFVTVIGEHFKLGASTLQAEAGGPNAGSSMLGHSVGRLVKENPVTGIGAHVNIDVCRLGGFSHGNNNERTFYPDGSIGDFQMPPIAETYEQFLEMCQDLGKAASGAIA
ncbi:MAG: hypothetical protein HYS17_07485 [Micavibrio aeruginosavorus]|uniref:Uncharacterized protein n=1 Tax=Micavibrio aeruginosavorus TaxID=349221 RepID=A0A7T5R0P6_9BACT|nr:MAG: hypothetical protein HYS17_07485 [Micavibrio aeruginosavorus]